MNDLDPSSQEFIDWAMGQISSKEGVYELLSGIVLSLLKFYLSGTPSETKSLLKSKMIRGAKEHGPLKGNTMEIDHELKEEYLDLLGWTLMKHYNKINNKFID